MYGNSILFKYAYTERERERDASMKLNLSIYPDMCAAHINVVAVYMYIFAGYEAIGRSGPIQSPTQGSGTFLFAQDHITVHFRSADPNNLLETSLQLGRAQFLLAPKSI